MGALETLEVGLVDANAILELFNVLGAPFTKGSLGLAIALLAFLRGGIDLPVCEGLFIFALRIKSMTYRFAASLALGQDMFAREVSVRGGAIDVVVVVVVVVDRHGVHG